MSSILFSALILAVLVQDFEIFSLANCLVCAYMDFGRQKMQPSEYVGQQGVYGVRLMADKLQFR